MTKINIEVLYTDMLAAEGKMAGSAAAIEEALLASGQLAWDDQGLANRVEVYLRECSRINNFICEQRLREQYLGR